MLHRWNHGGYHVTGTTRRNESASLGTRQLDLSKNIPTQWLMDDWSGFDVAVLCAASQGEANCKAHPEATSFVNITQTLALARLLAESGCFVIFMGSSHVFDGSRPLFHPGDPICPQGEYGRQKAAPEDAILKMGGAVIRSTKVFHKDLHILQAWRRDDYVSGTAFTNLYLSPVSLDAFCTTIERVAESRKSGIWHVSAPDQINYSQVAHLAGLEKQVRHEPVPPGLMDKVPLFSSLDASLTTDCFGIEFEPSAEVVRKALA